MQKLRYFAVVSLARARVWLYCLIVSWLFCFLYFTSFVSLTGFYIEDEPSISNYDGDAKEIFILSEYLRHSNYFADISSCVSCTILAKNATSGLQGASLK